MFLIKNDSNGCTESEDCFNISSYDNPFIIYCFCFPSNIVYCSKIYDTTTIVVNINFRIDFSDTVDQIIIENIRNYYSKTNSLLPSQEISNNDLRKEIIKLFEQGCFFYKLKNVERKPIQNQKECLQLKLLFIPQKEP